MYIPSAFRVDDEPTLFDFLDKFSFATLISQVEGCLFATHLPLLLDRERRVVRGHVACSNPHWQSFDGERESLAIFHGPHAYISPGWYATSPAVPTWNYAAVHVYGPPQLMTEGELAAFVDELERHFDGEQPPPGPSDAERGFRQNLLGAIVGFEIPWSRIEGKFKLGQNRSAADRAGMLAHLEVGTAEERALADFIGARAVATGRT